MIAWCFCPTTFVRHLQHALQRSADRVEHERADVAALGSNLHHAASAGKQRQVLAIDGDLDDMIAFVAQQRLARGVALFALVVIVARPASDLRHATSERREWLFVDEQSDGLPRGNGGSVGLFDAGPGDGACS